MSKTKIEWADETWNPIIGCSKISEGCENCYAEKMAGRLAEMDTCGYKDGDIITRDREGFHWTGRTTLVDSAFKKKFTGKGKRIFVCSMGDLFHDSVPFEWIDEIIRVIIKNPQHIFIFLTKRPERMYNYFNDLINNAKSALRLAQHTNKDGFLNNDIAIHAYNYRCGKPCTNLWLGVSAENQNQADKRIPLLLQIPAAKRFVSIEPMLGRVVLDDLQGGLTYETYGSAINSNVEKYWTYLDCLDWVICGGESGSNARPMHPDWVRSLRVQCKIANVPFFFKQWGEYAPAFEDDLYRLGDSHIPISPGCILNFSEWPLMAKIGKKKAGKILDGKKYMEVCDE